MAEITYIKQTLIDGLVSEAQALPRRRKNHNFHATQDHPCQRLVNVLMADSYIAPHRHLDSTKEEMMVILRGRIGMVYFDEAGNVSGTDVLEPNGDCLAVNIPAGTYHSCVALTDSAAFFEAKAGPYTPHQPGELAPFAPREGEAGVPTYLARMRSLFTANR
jgi:cupin fold WbuC family metalloprotein